jgi:hypothetical protein
MFGVKLTILMIVVTLIMKYLVKCALIKEDVTDLYLMAEGKKVTWYTVLFGFMVIFDFVGIIYSVIYLLFLR